MDAIAKQLLKDMQHNIDIVKEGEKTFLYVGEALRKLRDDGLYKAKYGTFEELCKAEFNRSMSAAYRDIDAAIVVNKLSPIGETEKSGNVVFVPENEAQARALVQYAVDDDTLKKLSRAVKAESTSSGKPVTAAAIKKKADELQIKPKASANGKPRSNGKPSEPAKPPEPAVEREPGDDTETETPPKPTKGKTSALEPLKVESVERVKGQTAIDKVKTDLDDADKEIGRFIRAADDLKTAGGMKNHKFVVDNYKIFAKGLAKLREDFTSLNGAWNSSKVEK